MRISNIFNLQSLLTIPALNTQSTEYRPVMLWHGLGDNYNASGIHDVNNLLNDIYPGIFFHSIYIEKNPSSDQQKSFFGDANEQIEQVCQQLSEIPQLKTASNGIDAIGFSQGGVLLRGLIERCSGIKVNNLITFGSPHMGVMEIKLCQENDWFCRRRNEILKKQVWYDNVQKSIIPAQYFRDPYEIEKYLKYSYFLADINNERNEKNSTYYTNISNLNKLVLVTFTEDTTVIPKLSAHFSDIDPETEIA
ncbi:uncharacterized protein KGF55_000515 [Candida pseudojiufengensis]|uniref:uncharacterized protein n=1 Tax=Candida pseudojiufengensis TaxID=497109 RepID=UPI0022256FA3|nr:uncharacterized protein KGF55_000515 [Candida pseudojiufengensis]KAI5966206.1 hypothetical protein KGF55_000515 [Candida pseudojiufengensis]